MKQNSAELSVAQVLREAVKSNDGDSVEHHDQIHKQVSAAGL